MAVSPVELQPPPADPGVAPASMEPQASILATSLVQHIEMGMAASARSRQKEVGASEIGMACARRLAYRHHDYPKFNYTDPMRLLIGIGVHLALAQIFDQISAATDRFLVEYRVEHSGVPGTLDLYDRATATLVDWKTTSKKRLTDYARNGPPQHYITQAQIYAAGLLNAGFPVKRIAIAFLPYDGALESLWVWLSTPDQTVADEAIERYRAVGAPYETPSTPDRTCGFCDYYNPQAKDLRLGCPGT